MKGIYIKRRRGCAAWMARDWESARVGGWEMAQNGELEHLDKDSVGDHN
jgi:hypothetical protein